MSENKNVRVKAVKNYYDRELKRSVGTGEEFYVTDIRAEKLVSASAAEVVSAVTTPEPPALEQMNEESPAETAATADTLTPAPTDTPKTKKPREPAEG